MCIIRLNYYLHNNNTNKITNTFKIYGVFFLYKAEWAQVHKDLSLLSSNACQLFFTECLNTISEMILDENPAVYVYMYSEANWLYCPGSFAFLWILSLVFFRKDIVFKEFFFFVSWQLSWRIALGDQWHDESKVKGLTKYTPAKVTSNNQGCTNIFLVQALRVPCYTKSPKTLSYWFNTCSPKMTK